MRCRESACYSDATLNANPTPASATLDDPNAKPLRTSTLVRRLLREHIRPYAGRLIVAGLCMALVAGTTALNAWLMQPVLDKVFLEKDATLLLVIPLAVLVVAIVKGLANFGQAYTMNYVGLNIVAALQRRMYRHLVAADLALFHGTASGKLTARFVNDVNMMRQAVSTTLTGMVKDALTLVFLVGLMVYQDWRLAILALIIFPVAILPVARLGKRMRRVSTGVQWEIGSFSAFLNETLQGIRHVKAYGMEAHESERADRTIGKMLKLYLRSAYTRAISTPIMETLGGIAVALVIYYGGSRVIAGETTPGTFFSFIAALIMAYQPAKSLAALNNNLQEGLSAAQRVFALLDTEPTIREKPDAAPLAVTAGTIRLEDVTFAYAPGEPALHDVSLEVPAGSLVALVGPSGAGKSTVMNLILRFYDPTEGRVTIDGTDIREATLSSLRGAIALVSQDVTLFDDTIGANIAYGRPGATQAEIEAAARDAAAHDFIAALPQGYDTVVGERGVKLSGGERQRIAIARAMLKDAPILLLDEATSSLDSESERHIQRALETLMRGRTTLVIAHRLSTVRHADRIIALVDGRVAETGRHAELLARNGVYARLHALQMQPDPASLTEEWEEGAPALAAGGR